MKKHIYLDFDGTITNRKGDIAPETMKELKRLKNKYLRVIVTGRTVSSFLENVGEDFPIDYLIFSTGAGIMEWTCKKIIDCTIFTKRQTKEIELLLKKLSVSFSIHHPIPDNHLFEYFEGEENVADFKRYIKYHGKNVTSHKKGVEKSTQFLIITKNKNYPLEKFDSIKKFANIFKIFSPIDHRTSWIEILPKNVSKSFGASKLCSINNFIPTHRIAIGNDFNDLDLLDWADESYLVDTASSIIKNNYRLLENGNNMGVANYLKKLD